MVRRLAFRFPNFIPEDQHDILEEQFSFYQTAKDLPDHIIKETCVDVYWGKIGKIESSFGKPYGVLSKFAKCLLCIPHGNADSERIFSHKSNED